MEPAAEEAPSGQASHPVENASSEKVFTGQSAQGASPVLEYRPGAQAAAANVHTCIKIYGLEGGKGIKLTDAECYVSRSSFEC